MKNQNKWWILPAALLAVFGLLMMGCPSGGGGDDDDDDATTAYSYEFKGDGSEYTLWGNKKPVLEDGWLKVDDGSSTSTGFVIKFADIGYTQKASDTLIFTYSVEIEEPEACLLTKIPKGDNMNDPIAGASYDTGGGKQHFLGSALKDDKDVSVSNYETPTKATWDAATKTGTFEVLMKHLGLTTGVGFQTNPWAEMGGKKVSENAKFKVKFLKVENAVGEAFVCDCDGDKTKCLCGADCDCESCDLPGDPDFSAGTGTKLTVKLGAANTDVATAKQRVGAEGEESFNTNVKFFDNNTGYQGFSENYGANYVAFQINFGASTYTKVAFDFQGVDGDVGWKKIYFWSSTSEPAGYQGVNTGESTDQYDNDGKGKQSFEIEGISVTGSTWCIINIHAGTSIFKVSNIVFSN